jgi:hypothetical protein
LFTEIAKRVIEFAQSTAHIKKLSIRSRKSKTQIVKQVAENREGKADFAEQETVN